MSVEELAREVVSYIEEKKDLLEDIAEKIWKQPELGYQEYFASEVLCKELLKANFIVEKRLGGLDTAFKAHKSGGNGHPSLAFFAEYDALPGLGHGCGHNLSAAAALGAALAIGNCVNHLDGTIFLVGTPAEEGTVPEAGGKIKLLASGALDDIDAALIVHADDKTVAERVLLARQSIDLCFKGYPAHAGGSPQEGKNALNAAILTLDALNALRQFLPEDVRLHGILSEGGTMINTVPEKSVLQLGLRASKTAILQRVKNRVIKCAEGAALATECSVKVSCSSVLYKHLVTNSVLGDLFYRALEYLEEPAIRKDTASYSSDMGNVSHEIPSLHPYFKIGPQGLTGHTPEFAKAACSEEGFNGMIIAAKALALTALHYFVEPEMPSKVHLAFKASQKDI